MPSNTLTKRYSEKYMYHREESIEHAVQGRATKRNVPELKELSYSYGDKSHGLANLRKKKDKVFQ